MAVFSALVSLSFADSRLFQYAGINDLLTDRWASDDEKAAKTKAKKKASKTAFECDGCGLKAWPRPTPS